MPEAALETDRLLPSTSTTPAATTSSNTTTIAAVEPKLSTFRWIQLAGVNALLLAVVVLFSLHPTFVGLFVLLFTNGILLQQNATVSQKRKRTIAHLYTQLSALISITQTLLITHGKFGILTFLSLWAIAIVGILIHSFPGWLGGPLRVRKYLYPAHRVFGYLVFTLVILTGAFAMLGTWAVAKLSPEARGGVAAGLGGVWVLVMAGWSGERFWG
ncbi:hypothetical protein BC829DRAFT_396702 [Chytridium lagenaria]|nr:hypothetical protein BC829DRAFT_396702 [Chytridium lagenaria]